MADVFVNPYKDKDSLVWSLQNCFLYIPGAIDQEQSGNTILASTQALTVSYQRAVDTRYPLASGRPIKVIGIPQGQLQMQTILGPTAAVDKFLKAFGATCKPFTLVVATSNASTDPTCQETAKPQKLTLKGCLGNAVTFSLSVSNNITIAQGNFAATFDVLDWQNSK